MMNATRFEEILAAYGADPARWPDGERDAALAFAQENPQHSARPMADAHLLDAALDRARTDPPGDLLMARILKTGEAQTRIVPPWARIAAVLALGAGLGLGWGGASLDGAVQGDAAYAMAFSSFADPAYDELADFIEDEVR